VADAAFAFRAAGIVAAEIEHVTIGTAKASWRTIGDPIEEKRRPRSGYHGAFSAPWVFACAMTADAATLTLADFDDDRLQDAERRRLAAICDVVVDDECTRVFPNQFPAVVTVQLGGRRTQTERVMTNLGGPQRPLGSERLRQKLAANAGGRAAAIAAACDRLAELPRAADLLAAAR
jgi:2-methylcitrate dehydratase PrpD